MAVSRRQFLSSVGGGAAAVPFISGRGFEAGWTGAPYRRNSNGLIQLDSNENPDGPSPRALEAIRTALVDANRYPDDAAAGLTAAVAKVRGVQPENVLLGCGSTEHLRLVIDAFTSAGRRLVTAAPSFETPATYAAVRGVPVSAVPVRPDLSLDLDQMLDRSVGAGLVYCCNPNNPTATVHGKTTIEDFVRGVLKRSPSAFVLVDEAYFEYVDDPSYGSLIGMALEEPRVVVLRTMSKVHGMAGLRVGYALARRETIDAMRPFQMPLSVNGLGAAAATASLADVGRVAEEQQKNREGRDYLRGWFEKAGFVVTPSAANFMMVAIRRPITEFKARCADRGVAVGRPFPPLDQHARISVGTMDELRRATKIFGEVLGL